LTKSRHSFPSSVAHLDAAEQDRWRIAEGLDVVLIGDNEALVQYGTRSRPAELLRDSDLTGVLRRVLHPLRDQGIAYADLIQRFDDGERAEVEDLLRELVEKGIVTNAARSPVEQYLGHALENRGSLAASRVAVIGAGPLGARVAHTLMQHGVGHIGILDERPADELWHAFLPVVRTRPSTSGQMAHEALRELLDGAASTAVAVIEGGLAAAGVSAAVADVDLAVLAMEQPHPRLAHLVNRVCLREGRTWLAVGIDGNIGLTGPLFVPPETACYNDYEALVRGTSSNSAVDAAYHRFLLRRGSGSFFPGLPAYVDIVAGFAAVAAVQYLSSGTSMAMARLLSIDFEEMRVDVDDVLKLPRCPVCAGGLGRATPPFPADARPDLEA
jgi:bacteriocin biosynthesis cyclodehydratase domain-containing protein